MTTANDRLEFLESILKTMHGDLQDMHALAENLCAATYYISHTGMANELRAQLGQLLATVGECLPEPQPDSVPEPPTTQAIITADLVTGLREIYGDSETREILYRIDPEIFPDPLCLTEVSDEHP